MEIWLKIVNRSMLSLPLPSNIIEGPFEESRFRFTAASKKSGFLIQGVNSWSHTLARSETLLGLNAISAVDLL